MNHNLDNAIHAAAGAASDIAKAMQSLTSSLYSMATAAEQLTSEINTMQSRLDYLEAETDKNKILKRELIELLQQSL